MTELPLYPDSCELTLGHRNLLHPLLHTLPDGISEFTFANLYLFRHTHNYTVSRLADDRLIILGRDPDTTFFMLPLDLADRDTMVRLLQEHRTMKCVSERQKPLLEAMGLQVVTDRDNFDYLYRRQDLAELNGRKFHKKRNLIKNFVNSNDYQARPLREEYRQDALQVLDDWRAGRDRDGDYREAREALLHFEELELCGGIYYVENRPVAYTLGEELAQGESYVIHFEKTVAGYKGLSQFINQSFASILPQVYETINREQDLGDDGLRQAKHSYKPMGYVKKYRALL